MKCPEYFLLIINKRYLVILLFCSLRSIFLRNTTYLQLKSIIFSLSLKNSTWIDIMNGHDDVVQNSPSISLVEKNIKKKNFFNMLHHIYLQNRKKSHSESASAEKRKDFYIITCTNYGMRKQSSIYKKRS